MPQEGNKTPREAKSHFYRTQALIIETAGGFSHSLIPQRACGFTEGWGGLGSTIEDEQQQPQSEHYTRF